MWWKWHLLDQKNDHEKLQFSCDACSFQKFGSLFFSSLILKQEIKTFIQQRKLIKSDIKNFYEVTNDSKIFSFLLIIESLKNYQGFHKYIKYKYIQIYTKINVILIIYQNITVLLYLKQENAALVGLKAFFQKHYKILQTPNFCNTIWHC